MEQNFAAEALFVRTPMPLLNTAFEPGKCKEAIEKIADEDSRKIAWAEYYYFSGQAEQASDVAEEYLTSDDIAIQLSACWIYAYANMALDRIPRTRKALAQAQESLAKVDENAPFFLKALAVAITTVAKVLLHLPIEGEIVQLKKCIHILPPGLRIFVLYAQAHYAYLNQQYGASLGIVETALALEGELYPISTIYLHLMAVMDYMSLRQPEMAREHMLAAWEIARPDDFIEPFGEHHGLVGGNLESVIKKEWPDDFKRMIAITYKFSAGWREIHNYETGNSVADDLTTTEFAVAMLAARGWSNKEIGAHLGTSANTVKLHISATLQKLGIAQRKELQKYMLK